MEFTLLIRIYFLVNLDLFGFNLSLDKLLHVYFVKCEIVFEYVKIFVVNYLLKLRKHFDESTNFYRSLSILNFIRIERNGKHNYLRPLY